MLRPAILAGMVALAFGADPVCAGEPAAPIVELAGGEIRLADIAELPSELEQLASRVVLHIPANSSSVTLDGASVAAILRREAPGLHLQPRYEGDVVLVRVAAAAPPAAVPSALCRVLAVPVADGDYIDAGMLADAACREQAAPIIGLVFDRDVRALRADGNLSAGTYVGRTYAREGTVVPAQSAMVLQVRSGPVLIERGVRTLNAARPGHGVFVRTDDGTVLAARIGESNQ